MYLTYSVKAVGPQPLGRGPVPGRTKRVNKKKKCIDYPSEGCFILKFDRIQLPLDTCQDACVDTTRRTQTVSCIFYALHLFLMPVVSFYFVIFIPHTLKADPWKYYLTWNRSMVQKRLETAALYFHLTLCSVIIQLLVTAVIGFSSFGSWVWCFFRHTL